jgi:hypothetical protein
MYLSNEYEYIKRKFYFLLFIKEVNKTKARFCNKLSLKERKTNN